MLRPQAEILIAAITCRVGNIGAARSCGCQTTARSGRDGIACTWSIRIGCYAIDAT